MGRYRIAIVGPASSGKSSIVGAIQGRALEPGYVPTSGCNKSSISRSGHTLDLLDLGGGPDVRKFWKQLGGAAAAIVVVCSAAEADDLAWAMLGKDVRSLCEQGALPALVLLNRLGVAEHACVSPDAALDRLGLDLPSYRFVRAISLGASDDVPAVEGGLLWLCAAMSGDESASRQGGGNDGGGNAAAPPNPLPPALGVPGDGGSGMGGGGGGGGGGGSRLRVVRAVREAQQYVGSEAAEVAAARERLEGGHLLTEREMEVLRAIQRAGHADR